LIPTTAPSRQIKEGISKHCPIKTDQGRHNHSPIKTQRKEFPTDSCSAKAEIKKYKSRKTAPNKYRSRNAFANK
jgi:hypothetical protein